MPCQIPRKTNSKPSPHPTPTILRRKSPSDIKPVDQLTSHSPHPLPLLAPLLLTHFRLQLIIDTMTLSVDGFLAKIDSMGRFQWILVCVVGIMLVPVTFQTLIMTFLGLEPPWRCVHNSSVCNFTRKCSAVSFRIFYRFCCCCCLLCCSTLLIKLFWRGS